MAKKASQKNFKDICGAKFNPIVWNKRIYFTYKKKDYECLYEWDEDTAFLHFVGEDGEWDLHGDWPEEFNDFNKEQMISFLHLETLGYDL